MKIRIYEDPAECRAIWEKMWPAKGLFDLWQVRASFHEAFSRPLRFQVIEENKTAVGFLALCWIEEENKFVQFPGETWHGKTWVEQNKIIAKTPEILHHLLDAVPGPLELRYLAWNPLLDFMDLMQEDEIGYLFFPGMHDYTFENYMLSFSGKSRKKLTAEMKKLEALKVTYRFNHKPDLDLLFKMNLQSFGEQSYFSDPRFYHSFENLSSFFDKMGMMRITTLLLDNQVAAVDLGAIWKNTYTLLAGGTNPAFPGVAKLINLHHLKWSCSRQFHTVDFLCGNFNWKERFHLTPVPLYKINHDNTGAVYGRRLLEANAACA